MTDTSLEETTAAIDAALGGTMPVFVPLPGGDLPVSERFRGALDGFQTHDTPAGRAAAQWLRDCAIREHLTSRTTVVLARERVLGYYSLCSYSIELDPAARAAAGVRADRKRVPATLMTWIARDPEAEITGGDLLAHAVARARRAHRDQATAVLVLQAFDETTAEMWLARPYPLHAVPGRGHRLWMALTGVS